MAKFDSTAVVRDMVAKSPSAPARTIAKALHKKYPHEFHSVEAARTRVRHVLGLNGAKRLGSLPDKSLVRPPRPAGFGSKLPDGIKQVPPPLQVDGEGRWLVISDVHIPYHDKPALTAAIEYGLKHECRNLLINGDWYDFYKLSEFSKDPKARDPEAELAIGREALLELSPMFPGRKLFKVGNHEERYEAYMRRRTPELAGDSYFSLENYLRLKESGFEYVAGRQYIRLGRLPVLHGHEFMRSFAPPVNAARGLYLKLKESALCSHHHTRSMHTEQSGLAKHASTCYSIACLCDLSPAYAPVNNYMHGFAVILLDKSGDYVVWNKQIINGVVTES